MKILIVYCHPNPASFCHAILDTIVAKFKALKNEVVVRDLYAMKFNPVLSGEDFVAFKSGKAPADIAIEQGHINWCDLCVFVYPLWWVGLPALVKGYIDRVYAFGFAYTMTPTGPKGLLTKNVVVIQTQGNPKEAYEKVMTPAMLATSDAGIFEFTGMKVLDHIFFPAVPFVTQEARQGYLRVIEEKVPTWT